VFDSFNLTGTWIVSVGTEWLQESEMMEVSQQYKYVFVVEESTVVLNKMNSWNSKKVVSFPMSL
jgi:hypothetical protein